MRSVPGPGTERVGYFLASCANAGAPLAEEWRHEGYQDKTLVKFRGGVVPASHGLRSPSGEGTPLTGAGRPSRLSSLGVRPGAPLCAPLGALHPYARSPLPWCRCRAGSE